MESSLYSLSRKGMTTSAGGSTHSPLISLFLWSSSGKSGMRIGLANSM